jgi:dolichol kinase
MAEFIYEINSILFNYLIIVLVSIYLIMMIPVIKRCFSQDLKPKWNTLIAMSLIVLSSILGCIPTPDGQYIVPYPVNYFVIVFASAVGLLFAASTLFGRTKNENYDRKLMEGIDQAASAGESIEIHNFNYHKEIQRKLIHLGSAAYSLVFIITPLVFGAIFLGLYKINPQSYVFEEYNNFYILGSGEQAAASAFAVLMLTLYGTFAVTGTAEIMRLRSPQTPFLMKKTLQVTRRVTETKTFGAHISIIIGFMIAAYVLFYDPAYRTDGAFAMSAVILVSCLADMLAALFGRKFGKKKWPFNKGKSYVGSFAGSVAAFVSSVFFVGWFLAFITVIVFLTTDLLLGKVNLSDNLTTPIILGFTYRLLIQFIAPIISVGMLTALVIF